MKTVQLSDLLDEEQIKQVAAIMNQERYSQRITELKEYLGSLREQLESKGILPEYLAYSLEYNMSLATVVKAGKGQHEDSENNERN